MDKSRYKLIQNYLTDKDDMVCEPASRRIDKGISKLNIILLVVLLAALSANALFFLRIPTTSSPDPVGLISRSPYAGLLNDFDVPFTWNTRFSGTNYTEVNKLWYEDREADRGVIAIDKSYAEHHGLPPSQAFPWDKRKKFYVTNGHHALHCLRAIYMSVDQFRFQKAQTWEWPHILHCMDTLRSDILCYADDTLRWTGETGLYLGEGQTRKCRNWNKLNEFVERHPGCFQYIEEGNTNLRNVERVKYCPNNSSYVPLIRKYFGFADDWAPWPVKL